MPLDEHDPGLIGLEAALAALAPMPGRIDRDALLFRAGQLSVRRQGWAWPTVAAALGMVAVVLGVVMAVRPSPAPVFITLRETAPPVPPTPEPLPPAPESEPVAPSPSVAAESPMNYLQLERQVVRWGMEGVPEMPEAQAPSIAPVTRASMGGVAAEPAYLTNYFDLRSYFQ